MTSLINFHVHQQKRVRLVYIRLGGCTTFSRLLYLCSASDVPCIGIWNGMYITLYNDVHQCLRIAFRAIPLCELLCINVAAIALDAIVLHIPGARLLSAQYCRTSWLQDVHPPPPGLPAEQYCCTSKPAVAHQSCLRAILLHIRVCCCTSRVHQRRGDCRVFDCVARPSMLMHISFSWHYLPCNCVVHPCMLLCIRRLPDCLPRNAVAHPSMLMHISVPGIACRAIVLCNHAGCCASV